VVAALPWNNCACFSALLHIGAVLLISQAWLGHAAEGGVGLYGDIMVTVYCIHVIAAASAFFS
jgi:copper resistance protein D